MVTTAVVSNCPAGRSKDCPAFAPMNKRRPNLHEDEDGLIVIGEHELPKTLLARIIHWFGEAILWLLACGLPTVIILYGIAGVRSKHLPAWRGRKESFGDDAVGFSWMVIGIGIWALGQCFYLKMGRPIFRLLGWLLAAGAFGIGLWILLRRFIHQQA